MEIKLLPCPVCASPNFDGVDTLRNTLVRVATNLVSCPVCSEMLLGLDKLTIHLFGHIGDSTTTTTTLQEKPDVSQEIGNLDIVEREIDSKIDLECCSNSSDGPVKCDICNFSFTDKHILDIHQKLLHQTPADVNTGSYSYHCHLCSKKFKMRGSLMVHLRVAHYGFVRKDNYRECSESKTDIKAESQDVDGEDSVEAGGGGERNLQGKFQDNKQWECDVCSKLFTTKYFLKKHKRLHTGEMPYCCSLCNKSFTFQQSYHKHMLYHSSEKPHVCNECGRAFKELSTLQNHARIHSGERPFICETCGKSFRQRVSYLVHRRIHTGVMPYKCTTCDKSFRYKVSQKSHKCLMNPPGGVAQIADQQSIPAAQQNSPKCIMNVDLDTGSISVVPHERNGFSRSASTGTVPQEDNGYSMDKSQTSPGYLVQKKSILINNNELIEISYNKADLRCTVGSEDEGRTQKSDRSESQDEFEKLIYTDSDKELFSPTMANLLPEVESLYLNNSPTNSLQMHEREESINDMREKCLEELLKAIE